MKAHTNIEQSKKLAEILPLESADMYWWNDERRYEASLMDAGFISDVDIPAWSLSALLELIPPGNILLRDALSGKYKCINTVDSNLYDNPIDACYEMIIKLHEQNLL